MESLRQDVNSPFLECLEKKSIGRVKIVFFPGSWNETNEPDYGHFLKFFLFTPTKSDLCLSALYVFVLLWLKSKNWFDEWRLRLCICEKHESILCLFAEKNSSLSLSRVWISLYPVSLAWSNFMTPFYCLRLWMWIVSCSNMNLICITAFTFLNLRVFVFVCLSPDFS